jgi:DNA-binding response OmpR family regulator
MDMGIPSMTGLEPLKKIREEDNEVPITMLS